MITNMIRMEARNSDHFPVILNPDTIDLLILPPGVFCTRGIDTGLTDSEVSVTWDYDTLGKSMMLKMFHTNSRNTKFMYKCVHKLCADLSAILKDDRFMMLACTPVDNTDHVAVVNLSNVHQMRWNQKASRLYFDFSLGGRQFLQAVDTDDLLDDVKRIEQGWHDHFVLRQPTIPPVKNVRHRPKPTKPKAARTEIISSSVVLETK